MSDPYLGEIRIFAGNFAPQGWQFCNGQLLPINQYAALFSLLGTTYGGNGVSTFALPNLQGRCVLGMGVSTTGVSYQEGQSAGTENVTILTSNMPVHAHAYAQAVNNADADQTDPSGAIPAVSNASGRGTETSTYTKNPATGTMLAQQTAAAGGSVPMSTMQPYLVINYIIAMSGIFPSRG
jgi:microcystin-dependent protein